MLGFVLGLLCCVGEAAEPFDENFADLWRSKIEKSLAAEGHVRVFYFSKEKKIYSATYDVRSSEVEGSFYLDGKFISAIIPVAYSLEQEFLLGYVLKEGVSPPKIIDADFSLKNATLDDYHQTEFSSPILDYFLTEICPRLVAKGKEIFDHDVEALTADMLKTAPQEWKKKSLFWTVVSEEKALEMLQNGRTRSEMLLIVGGVGILRGRRTFRWFKFVASPRSLYCYKWLNALSVSSVLTKYPFSQQKRLSCINYTGANKGGMSQETKKETVL